MTGKRRIRVRVPYSAEVQGLWKKLGLKTSESIVFMVDEDDPLASKYAYPKPN